MSAKERRKSGFYSFFKESHDTNYSLYENLHKLWISYIEELTYKQKYFKTHLFKSAKQLNRKWFDNKIARADFHGAMFKGLS